MTCSLEPEENEDVVDALLEGRPAFARVPPSGVSTSLAGVTDASGLVRILPGPATDGFSAILLRRLRR